MAKHEFGIMMNTPRQSERYDEYEPWKYECIASVDKGIHNKTTKYGLPTY